MTCPRQGVREYVKQRICIIEKVYLMNEFHCVGLNCGQVASMHVDDDMIAVKSFSAGSSEPLSSSSSGPLGH
jgi:hypothetical protein